MRIAFLTNEFVSETNNQGGLANYLNRMTQALVRAGHECEVFVLTMAEPTNFVFNNVLIHRVNASPHPLFERSLSRIAPKFWKQLTEPWGGVYGYFIGARAVARAFWRRHRAAPFDMVQSANCGAVGLFIGKSRRPLHVTRLSSDRDLWFEADGRERSFGLRALCWIERLARRRATVVYAPSAFLARHCWKRWGEHVEVIRPPLYVETEAASVKPKFERYLIHFGQMGRRKGTDMVARAFRKAHEQSPDIRMIWAGREIRNGDLEAIFPLLGKAHDSVDYVGPVPKPELCGLLAGAVASVLPSRIDNLPNTAVESLLFGVPVLAFEGGSLDEIVIDGRTGLLTPMEDEGALAKAMVRMWNHDDLRPNMNKFVTPDLDAFTPEHAVNELIELVDRHGKLPRRHEAAKFETSQTKGGG